MKNPQYFKTWLIRILINECNQILRHYKKVNTIEEVPETPRQDKTLAEFEFKEMLEQVDEKYRVILVLYYEQGFKISEIAELLELNENTVKTRLARAREQIRSAYFQEDTGKKDKSIGRERSSDEKTNQFSNRREYTAG